MTTSGAHAASIRESRSILSALRSGALSCTKSAPATAAATEPAQCRRPVDAPSASPSSRSAGHAAATWRRSRPSAPGAGSQPTTSRPAARNWAAQPLPMVPAADAGDAAHRVRSFSHRAFLPDPAPT